MRVFPKLGLIIGIFLLFSTCIAIAGPAPVENLDIGNYGNEPSHNSILEQIYGLNNLTRIDDALDQVWYSMGEVTVIEKAKQAGYGHDKLWLAGKEEHFLFSTPRKAKYINNCHEVECRTASFNPNGEFYFGIDPTKKSDKYSIDDMNVDGYNHMITYQITSAIDRPWHEDLIGDYVVAWEDIAAGELKNYPDWDYQDNILHISGANPSAIPEIPAGAAVPLMGLIGFGLWRLRKKAAKKK